MNTRGKNERGASAVEYGLLAALIAVALIVAVQAIGVILDGILVQHCSELGGDTCRRG